MRHRSDPLSRFQGTTQRAAAAPGGARPLHRIGALPAPGTARADSRVPPAVRPQDFRVRPGAAAVLRARQLPAEHSARLRAADGRELRREDSVRHRLGTVVRK